MGVLLRRLGAMVYDGLLLVALWFVATAIWLPFTGGEAIPYPGLLRVWLLAVSFVFFGWFWTHGGQTLGLRAWRLRVERADGAPLTWRLFGGSRKPVSSGITTSRAPSMS